MKVQLTILNAMAGRDVEASLARHREWGLRWVDLKDAFWGKSLLDLTDEEVDRLAGLLEQHELGTWCLSTSLFGGSLDQSREAFEVDCEAGLKRALEVAQRLRPHFVRLLGARSDACGKGQPGRDFWRVNAPWLPKAYAEAAKRIEQAGFRATIENETKGCILASVGDFEALFSELGADVPLSLTWDIQNHWQCGEFPTLEIYRRLRPLIEFVHLKGGRAEVPGGPLRWSAPLSRASWPLREIVSAVLEDGVSPVICLNPSHGEAPPAGEPTDDTEHNIAFLRETFSAIE